MWRAVLLASLGIALADKASIKRQHHLYGSTSEGPTVETYLGEATLACTPDMFPPGELYRVWYSPRLSETPMHYCLNLLVALRL